MITWHRNDKYLTRPIICKGLYIFLSVVNITSEYNYNAGRCKQFCVESIVMGLYGIWFKWVLHGLCIGCGAGCVRRNDCVCYGVLRYAFIESLDNIITGNKKEKQNAFLFLLKLGAGWIVGFIHSAASEKYLTIIFTSCVQCLWDFRFLQFR